MNSLDELSFSSALQNQKSSEGRESHLVIPHLESDFRADSSAFPKETDITLQKMAFLWENIVLLSCIWSS